MARRLVEYQECVWEVLWRYDAEHIAIRVLHGSEVQVVKESDVRPADK